MSKIFRLADGVLDLGLVKLVNLGMDPDKSNWNLSIIWERISQILKVHYDYRPEHIKIIFCLQAPVRM